MKFCVFVSSCCSLYHESGFNYCVFLQGSVGASKSEKVGKFCVCIWQTARSGRISSVRFCRLVWFVMLNDFKSFEKIIENKKFWNTRHWQL